MTWHVRVAPAIDAVGAGPFERLEAPSFYLSHEWLRATEGLLAPIHPYLVAERDGRVGGVAPCQFAGHEGVYAFYDPRALLLDEDRLPELAAAWRPRADGLLPALLGTAPRGYRSGICYDATLGRRERAEVADAVVAAFGELAAERGARTAAFLYLPAGADPHLEAALTAHGYAPCVLAGDCSLPVRWPDIDGYLASFRNKRRWALRSDIRRFEASGCTVAMGGVELLDDRLADLQAATQRRYGHDWDAARVRRWFATVRSQLSASARVSVARRGAAPVGFALLYEGGGELYCRAAGFDYSSTAGERSYFNVVFYEPIRYMAAHDLRRLHLGMESYEAKLARGCELTTLQGWFRFEDPDFTELLALQSEARLAHLEALASRFAPA